jgi:hypothetical protein
MIGRVVAALEVKGVYQTEGVYRISPATTAVQVQYSKVQPRRTDKCARTAHPFLISSYLPRPFVRRTFCSDRDNANKPEIFK